MKELARLGEYRNKSRLISSEEDNQRLKSSEPRSSLRYACKLKSPDVQKERTKLFRLRFGQFHTEHVPRDR